MVVVMQERATDEQVQRVISQLVEMGFDVHRSTGALRTVIGAVGGNRAGDPRLLEVLEGVLTSSRAAPSNRKTASSLWATCVLEGTRSS